MGDERRPTRARPSVPARLTGRATAASPDRWRAPRQAQRNGETPGAEPMGGSIVTQFSLFGAARRRADARRPRRRTARGRALGARPVRPRACRSWSRTGGGRTRWPTHSARAASAAPDRRRGRGRLRRAHRVRTRAHRRRDARWTRGANEGCRRPASAHARRAAAVGDRRRAAPTKPATCSAPRPGRPLHMAAGAQLSRLGPRRGVARPARRTRAGGSPRPSGCGGWPNCSATPPANRWPRTGPRA